MGLQQCTKVTEHKVSQLCHHGNNRIIIASIDRQGMGKADPAFCTSQEAPAKYEVFTIAQYG